MIKQRQYSAVARSYATALFNVAKEQGTLDRLAEESAAVEAAIEANPRLKIFMASPRISTEEKMGLIERVFSGRISELLMRALMILVRRERTIQLDAILDLLQQLIEEDKGIHPAVVQTARELPEEDRWRLQAALEKYTGMKLNIDYQIDPRLIGGIVFQLADMLIDTSMRSYLEDLRRRLKETKLLSE